jgi:hypothetical protein
MWNSQILAMRCFHRRETVRVVRERLSTIANVENDASDAAKMVAILCDKPSLFNARSRIPCASPTIPDLNHVSQAPYMAYAQHMNCRGRGRSIGLKA